MKLSILLATLLSTAAWSQDVVKVFADKGSFFLKAEPKHALAVGTELPMFSDARAEQAAGSAMVMELTGALARISLDDEATRANARFTRLGGPAPKAAEAPREKTKAGQLEGRLSNGLVRVVLNNDSDQAWSGCELRFDDGRYYEVGPVAPHSEDTVITLKFSRPPSAPEPLYDHVLVTCDEGSTKFFFANPHSPGALKGYAEDEGGRVNVHNTSDVPWQRCDVRKPNRTHYVLSRLKPHDRETIRASAFVKDPEAAPPPATELALNCKQGRLAIPLR